MCSKRQNLISYFATKQRELNNSTINYMMRTYGSSRLKLRPLQPFVGLDATNAMRIAATAKQTALQDS
jgi:hypothetical protein